MNFFYAAINLTKQAVDQQHKRQLRFDQQLNFLIIDFDLLRRDHPGCGLEKAYDTLQPSFIGRDRFVDFFKELGYRVQIPKNFIKTTRRGSYVCQNLIEGMIVNRVNQVVQSDITYILIAGQFYYAVFIFDVFSKRIVGYQVTDNMRKEANLKALKQVIKLRGNTQMNGLIHHSDRGSQYGSDAYRDLLTKHKVFLSMDKSAQKNAYAERINGIIKNEYLVYWDIPDFPTLKSKMKKAVNHYNNLRIHRHLPKKLSPFQFEQEFLTNPSIEQHRELIYHPNNFVKRPQQKHFFKQLESTEGLFCPILFNNFST